MLPINYLHERKTMIKSKKNTIGIVKDVICKVAPKKQLQTVLALCMNPQNQSALGINLKLNIIYIQIRKVEIDYKKILSIILVMVFMITFNNNVYAAELDNMQHNDQAYVLNSFSGNNLESISVRF